MACPFKQREQLVDSSKHQRTCFYCSFFFDKLLDEQIGKPYLIDHKSTTSDRTSCLSFMACPIKLREGNGEGELNPRESEGGKNKMREKWRKPSAGRESSSSISTPPPTPTIIRRSLFVFRRSVFSFLIDFSCDSLGERFDSFSKEFVGGHFSVS